MLLLDYFQTIKWSILTRTQPSSVAMWLLSTDRAELHYFSPPFSANGSYAILSHIWEGKEQTFQQLQEIGEHYRRQNTHPQDDAYLFDKIRQCCILAEGRGYRWVWVDSCCIDKTDSTELSEYSDCEACYAYLADVPSDCILAAPRSAFRRSRRHT